MAGEFLPPVVTRLTGDIGDLLGKIEEAKAAIKSIGDVTAKVNFEINTASLAKVKAAAAAALKGISVPVKFDISDASLAKLAALMGAAKATTGDLGGGGGGGMAGWFRLTGNAIHWLIMGTLEIAATAIPAIVAFGAAAAGMAATFVHIGDRMNFLRTATGDWRTAMIDSVGPLHNIGSSMGILQRAMAPDAYTIFGAAINTLSGHFGVFSHVAQEAGKVVTNFAVKLSNELSGSMGQQISGFFSGAVKDMTEWGQLLGNLGHVFVNVVGAMWGTAKVLLFAFLAISKALLAITNNPVGAFIIGLAAAFSAAYRWSMLLGRAWIWLGGSALVGAIKSVGVYMGALAALVGEEGVVVGATQVMGDLIDLALGPVGLAFAAVGLVVGAYVLSTRQAGDATDKLIAHVRQMPDNLASVNKGFGMLLHGLTGLRVGIDKGKQSFGQYMAALRSAHPGGVTGDINKLTQALQFQAEKVIALRTGLAEVGFRTGAVGAAMKTLAIDTALQDSKVTQLNQGIDQYLGLVTGGTGSLQAFASATNSFGHALTQSTGAASASWNKFSTLVGQTAPGLMDWFRQAAVLGATTGQKVSKAALDMAAAMAKDAGSNKTAQAQVLAFARANGINVRSFKQLEQEVKKNGAGQADLTKKVDATTIALSHLSQMAQNASTALNSQVSTAIANTALAAVNFHQKLMQLARDEANGAPAAKIQADQRAVAAALKQAQDQAVQTGNGIQRSMSTAQAAVARAKGVIDALRAALARLPRNIHINVDIAQHGGITLPGGGYNRITVPGVNASGTSSWRGGWTSVGELGPELVHLPAGSRVMPNHLATGSAGAAASGGGDTIVQVFLDGRQMFPAVKKQTLNYNVRNGNRDASGRPRGVLVPRGA